MKPCIQRGCARAQRRERDEDAHMHGIDLGLWHPPQRDGRKHAPKQRGDGGGEAHQQRDRGQGGEDAEHYPRCT